MGKTLKFGIVLLVLLCLFLGSLLLFDFVESPQAAGLEPTITAVPTGDPDLVSAVESVLATYADVWQDFTYQIDHIQIQDDGQMAIVWLAAGDPDTGELIGREPELALAELGEDGTWQVLLNDDAKFIEAFQRFQYAEKSVQGDLLTEEEYKPKTAAVYGGYYLPWAEGLTKRLTWSVGHTSCYPIYYCTHAFDYADGTMFPIVATKGGTVYHWKDTCANGDTGCTNSITLEDRSTTPWSYQLYLHIAKDSIPSGLKKVGTRVLQGQFIANVDDTGYSTGHHLHFMVVSERTRYVSRNGYVWGVAEDITYRDVSINWDPITQGGRPRLAYEAESYGGEGQTNYTSGNKPAFPPTGGLTAPVTKTQLTDRLLTVSGWGEDDISVTKMEILANYNGTWVAVGDEQSANPFTTSVDVCEAGIPNGPFKLGLRVWDYEGNPSQILTIRKLIKDVECGPAGSDPIVRIALNGGVLALPKTGMITAEATPGDAGGGEIQMVEFWLHGTNWVKDKWVKLGKDSNGENGWQVKIDTTDLAESRNYTVVAIATDSNENAGVDVNFNAIVDKSSPWVNFANISSPVLTNKVTLNWKGGDSLAGLAYYTLAVNVDNAGYQVIERSLPADTTTYKFPVQKEQLVFFRLTAYDRSGNQKTQTIGLYTEGYVLTNSYSFPSFMNFGD